MPQKNVQKSFEQSLRATSPFPALLRPRSDYHKGCTGKAHNGHGGGTNNKIIRQTSSSLSDSSSELSVSTPSDRSKASDKKICRSLSQKDPKDHVPLQRQGSLRLSRQDRKSLPQIDSKPPWHHVYTTKLDSLRSESDVKRNESSATTTMATGRLMRSRRRTTAIYWQQLYDRAVGQKLYGGAYKRFVFESNKKDGETEHIIEQVIDVFCCFKTQFGSNQMKRHF